MIETTGLIGMAVRLHSNCQPGSEGLPEDTYLLSAGKLPYSQIYCTSCVIAASRVMQCVICAALHSSPIVT